MSQNKQRNQKIVLELALQPGNNICADCKARLPRWASHNLGIFICVNCASIHRKIGTHITKVKSLTMDDWSKEQVENMKSIGNINSNRIYNPNEIRNPPPPNLEESERDSEIEQYIRAKYEYRKFFDRSALVASKLGNSRPASLAQVPAATFPQPVSLPRSSAHQTNPPVAVSTVSTSSYTAPPPKLPQMLPASQPPQPSGVWDDINSLKGNNNISQNSSLPLQYQQPTYSQGNSMQLPAVNGALGANNNYFAGGPTSGMGLNPYQSDQVRTNPFSQQQSRPSFPPSSMTSSFSTTPTMSSQPFKEQSFGVSQSSTSLPVTPAYYNPQPQNSMQIQNPSGQSFITGSPNHLFPSTQPTGQPRFSPQNHNSIPQQQQYISHSPQPMQSSPNPQFMYQSPGPAQPQIGGHNVPVQSPFLGMTTMQMQQQQQQMQMQQQQQQMQQHQQQQQQMQHQHQPQQLGQNYYPSMQPQMMSHQVNNAYSQTPAYPQGGFPPQTGGGQWGNTM